MTLMTDDIEWYPLPEVDDIHDDVKSSQGTLSTTASQSSTAPSLNYLTPASSVGSFRPRRQLETNPHITGTIQPYLRRPQKSGTQLGGKNHAHKGNLVEPSQSQKSISSASSFSTAWSNKTGESWVRQPTLSLSRKNSSMASFKTARSASVPALKSSQLTNTSQATHHSEKPRLTPVVSGSPGDEDENSNAKRSSTQPPAATTSGGRRLGDNASSLAATSAQRLSTAPSWDIPSGTTEPLDSSITSSVLTASPPATSPLKTQPPPRHLSSGALPAGLNQGTQTPAIPPNQLNHLWTQFLASYLTSGSARRPGSSSVVSGGGGGYSETGVQTTPSLAANKPPSRSPQPAAVVELPQRLSQLTLQESLQSLRPDFVRRSEQRQRELRRSRDLRARSHCRAATEPAYHPHNRPITRDRGKCQRTPHFVLIDVTRNRPKMSPVEMYRNSKKYWCKLPEVQQKEQEERRASQAATNRLRMKLYQQKVLERLRKQKK